MKQKYVVLKDDEKGEYILREFAELDKDALSLLCEEHYPAAAVDEAAEKGRVALIQALRTPNMYPPAAYIERIADLVIALREGAESPAEVILDDVENIIQDRKEAEAAEVEEESSDIDELLEDDENLEDDFEEDDIPSIDSNSSLKIADDDSLDVDEDT
jgi:hypothetical protein